MRMFGRRRNTAAVRSAQREEQDLAQRHLEEFVRTRVGVEAFIEPRTTVTPPTLLLVAGSGEWTRRRVTDPSVVRDLADRLALPIYDARLVGYPQRMRDWNERAKRERRPES
jgi:transposase